MFQLVGAISNNKEMILSENPRTPWNEPEFGSKSALSYYWASLCDLRLLHFVADTVMKGDFAHRILQDALDGKEVSKELDPTEMARKEPGPRTKAFRASGQELIEMFLSRAVDNFQIYVVEILREVLHKQPRILSASKQEITLGYVLQFDSIESLTRDWIEGRVASLSYEGFGDLEDWCHTKGIPILVPEGQRNAVVELIATRNLIVHNRGIVDDRYLKIAHGTKFAIGRLRELTIDDFLRANDLLNNVVKVTDGAIAGKFDLPLVPLRGEIRNRVQARWPATSKSNASSEIVVPEQESNDGASDAPRLIVK